MLTLGRCERLQLAVTLTLNFCAAQLLLGTLHFTYKARFQGVDQAWHDARVALA